MVLFNHIVEVLVLSQFGRLRQRLFLLKGSTKACCAAVTLAPADKQHNEVVYFKTQNGWSSPKYGELA